MQTLAIISTQAYSIANFRGSLIKELIAQKICVYALASDYDSTTRSAVVALGAIPIDMTMARAELNPFKDIFNCIKLYFILKRLKPDAVLNYFIKPVIYATIVARLAKIKNVFVLIEGLGYSFTDTSEYKKKLLKKVVSLLYRFSLSLSKKVVFMNKDDMNLFISNKIVSSSKVINLNGIGVDLNKWKFKVPILKPITFIFVARLLKEKGIFEYINAAKIIKNKYPDTRFLVLGATDVNPSSIDREDINAWVETGLIEWPGHVEASKWLSQSSVFVLPSYREGLPRSTQEAMAMGLPVITTDVPGCRETVQDGVNGYLIPFKNTHALVDVMLYFINNPDQIISMGKKSYEIAVTNFDEKIKNRIIIDILNFN